MSRKTVPVSSAVLAEIEGRRRREREEASYAKWRDAQMAAFAEWDRAHSGNMTPVHLYAVPADGTGAWGSLVPVLRGCAVPEGAIGPLKLCAWGDNWLGVPYSARETVIYFVARECPIRGAA